MSSDKIIYIMLFFRYNGQSITLILACYISNIVMAVTIKHANLKQPIQGILK